MRRGEERRGEERRGEEGGREFGRVPPRRAATALATVSLRRKSVFQLSSRSASALRFSSYATDVATERGTERDRETERRRQRQRGTEREQREGERQRGTERGREAQREGQRETERGAEIGGTEREKCNTTKCQQNQLVTKTYRLSQMANKTTKKMEGKTNKTGGGGDFFSYL